MTINLKGIGDVLIYLGMLATALFGIGVLLRYMVYRPLMKKLRDELIPKTNVIHAEVTPNHGASMKDTVTRTELHLETLTQRFNDHIVNH